MEITLEPPQHLPRRNAFQQTRKSSHEYRLSDKRCCNIFQGYATYMTHLLSHPAYFCRGVLSKKIPKKILSRRNFRKNPIIITISNPNTIHALRRDRLATTVRRTSTAHPTNPYPIVAVDRARHLCLLTTLAYRCRRYISQPLNLVQRTLCPPRRNVHFDASAPLRPKRSGHAQSTSRSTPYFAGFNETRHEPSLGLTPNRHQAPSPRSTTSSPKHAISRCSIRSALYVAASPKSSERILLITPRTCSTIRDAECLPRLMVHCATEPTCVSRGNARSRREHARGRGRSPRIPEPLVMETRESTAHVPSRRGRQSVERICDCENTSRDRQQSQAGHAPMEFPYHIEHSRSATKHAPDGLTVISIVYGPV